MSYLTQDEISAALSMQHRVAQAAAQEGVGTDPVPGDPSSGQPLDPDRWAWQTRRTWAAAPGWSDAWESAKVTHPEPDYDPGADEGVITDGQILAQVQSMIAPP